MHNSRTMNVAFLIPPEKRQHFLRSTAGNQQIHTLFHLDGPPFTMTRKEPNEGIVLPTWAPFDRNSEIVHCKNLTTVPFQSIYRVTQRTT